MTGPSGALRVLGLDPGTRHFGWGLAERAGVRLRHVAHGVISPGESLPLGERLVAIERGLVEVLAAHAPDECAIESLFFARDPSAAAKLGHARGVALLVCARAGLPTGEYPPARVKSTVVGGGKAAKDQVAQMVRLILSLPTLPPADAADALAVALTHLQRAPLAARLAPGKQVAQPRRQASLRGKVPAK